MGTLLFYLGGGILSSIAYFFGKVPLPELPDLTAIPWVSEMSSYILSIPGETFRAGLETLLAWNLVVLGVYIVYRIVIAIIMAVFFRHIMGIAGDAFNRTNSMLGLTPRLPTRKLGPGY
jgi:hypothetical protein